ncbi:hypothetical protein TRVL_03734 [Trypanosoma vivax]|nr:hypothetical protein TRVL_03734 [Trypanosoma vivax]
MNAADTCEEVPLEIVDYSCSTCFEEVVREIAQYIVEEFHTRPELRQFVYDTGAQPDLAADCDVTVTGRRFPIRRGRSVQDGDPGIAVEIHAYNLPHKHHWQQQQQHTLHPIVRLFAVPVFFLARSTTNSSSYTDSEASFYLSLLTTAVGCAMRGPLTLRYDTDPLDVPSPFFYERGMAPCFVSVGEHYKGMFVGMAPASTTIGGAKGGANSLQDLVLQPVIKRRFQCSAYASAPELCRRLSDYVYMFQLHIGPRSHIVTKMCDGICLSTRRTYKMKVPRRFPMDGTCGSTSTDTHYVDRTLSWESVLETENKTTLPCGLTTFPFGTGTVPLEGICFTFQWNQLHGTEVPDDGGCGYSLDPFTADSTQLLQHKLVIHAGAIPRHDYEVDHNVTNSAGEYVFTVMERLSWGIDVEAPAYASDRLERMADDVIHCHLTNALEQRALINQLVAGGTCAGELNADIRSVYFPGSLLCRFAYVCATSLDSCEEVCLLWQLVVMRLKSFLSGGAAMGSLLQQLAGTIGLPETDEIDHNLPLLVQKLYFLSYCVRRMHQESKRMSIGHAADGWDDWVEEEVERSEGDAKSFDFSSKQCSDAVNRGKRLITNGEPLMEPEAIPLPPCTSDIFYARSSELEKLGTAHVAQCVRAHMQSEHLFNDMCLFLYVNGAQDGRVVRFPDFVQWHSPRDFVQPPSRAGAAAGEQCSARDDNEYLSKRMHRPSAEHPTEGIWWSLWDRATPRPRSEIIAQSFDAYEQARLTLNWLEHHLSSASLLLETVNANFSNALHRMLSHRCVRSNRAIASFAARSTQNITHSIRKLTGVDVASTAMETFRSTYATALREVEAVETRLCAALAVERMLGASAEAQAQMTECTDPPQTSGGRSTDVTCTSVGHLVSVLSSPDPQENDAKQKYPSLQLPTASLTWDVWCQGNFAQKFGEWSRAPTSSLTRATCMAERPLNTAPCFQQMIVETEESGIFRVALTVGEEVF